jgi:AraC-like DNA-binding protein
MRTAIGKPIESQDEFFASLAKPISLLDLFEFLPDVYMYVKDLDGRYMRVNRVACQVMGAPDQASVIGKNDFDFFPPAVASQYVDEDRRVIEVGKPLTNQVWLVPGAAGVPRWYLCNKIPLFDREGHIMGIAGVKRPYEHAGAAPTGYARLLRVVEFVTERFGQPIEVAELARLVDLSVSQLQREFGRLFGITPVQYIREVRVGVACHLLETSSQSLTSIAVHCGFYDQSHFTRQFKASTGLTPLDYRRRFGT